MKKLFIVYTNENGINSKKCKLSSPIKRQITRALNGGRQVSFQVGQMADEMIFQNDSADERGIKRTINNAIYSGYHTFVVLHRTTQHYIAYSLQETYPRVNIVVQSHISGDFYYEVLPALLEMKRSSSVNYALRFFPGKNALERHFFIMIEAGRFPDDQPRWLSDAAWDIVKKLQAIPREGAHLKHEVIQLLRKLQKSLGL
ncbi:MAG: hypothetical protein AAF985_13560 [Bacteroidota bacterium]